jgi:hypothetical protein
MLLLLPPLLLLLFVPDAACQTWRVTWVTWCH